MLPAAKPTPVIEVSGFCQFLVRYRANPYPDLLLFEGAVLFHETPPEPQERRQGHHRDANDQRHEAPWRMRRTP